MRRARWQPLAMFVAVVIVGSVALNRAKGDRWAHAFLWMGTAVGLGMVVGGAYYVSRRRS